MINKFELEDCPKRKQTFAADDERMTWSSSSADLNVISFCVVMWKKDISIDIDELKLKIAANIETVYRDMLLRAWEELDYRLGIFHVQHL
jgi:hypothetical protein